MDFDAALARFIELSQKRCDAHFTREYPNNEAPRFSVDPGGKRYVRVVRSDSVSRSVHVFIEIATGDILAAAGWKGPAKHTRGNIYNADPLEGTTNTGAVYLR